METIEEYGDWWLPNNEESRTAGMVKYSPSDGVKLELKGTFEDVAGEEAFAQLMSETSSNRVSRIHGLLSTGQYATVEAPLRVSVNYRPGEIINSVTYRSGRLYLGSHISEKTQFSKIVLNIPELAKWANESVIEPIFETDEENIDFLKYKEVEHLYAILEPAIYVAELEDCTVKLTFSHSGEVGVYNTELNTTGTLELEFPGARKYEDIWNKTTDILTYISFVVGSGKYPEKITVYPESSEENIQVLQKYDVTRDEEETSQLTYLIQPNAQNFEIHCRNI